MKGMAAIKQGRHLKKAPTNRTESVEVLVERPVYPTKTLPADRNSICSIS